MKLFLLEMCLCGMFLQNASSHLNRDQDENRIDKIQEDGVKNFVYEANPHEIFANVLPTNDKGYKVFQNFGNSTEKSLKDLETLKNCIFRETSAKLEKVLGKLLKKSNEEIFNFITRNSKSKNLKENPQLATLEETKIPQNFDETTNRNLNVLKSPLSPKFPHAQNQRNRRSAPKLNRKTRQNFPGQETADNWANCALKSELQQHALMENMHILSISQEVKKLHQLVRLLQDQQYILNILNDFDNKPRSEDMEDQRQLIKLLQLLKNNIPSGKTWNNNLEPEGKSGDPNLFSLEKPRTSKSKQNPNLKILNEKPIENRENITNLAQELNQLKHLIVNKSLQEVRNRNEEEKLQHELENQKKLLKDLEGRIENLKTPRTESVIKDDNKEIQTNSKMRQSEGEAQADLIQQELQELENKLSEFMSKNVPKSSDSESSSNIVGASLLPKQKFSQSHNPSLLEKLRPKISKIKPTPFSRKSEDGDADLENLLNLLSEDKAKPKSIRPQNSETVIEDLQKQLSSLAQHKNIKPPLTVPSPNPRANEEEFMENLQRLLEGSDPNPELKENTVDLLDNTSPDLEDRLSNLQKRMEVLKKIQQLEKKVKQLHDSDDAETKTIDDDDDGASVKKQLKKLMREMKKLNKNQIEGKDLNDPNDIQQEFKNLQAEINGLKPNDDDDGFGKIAKGGELQFMLNKLFQGGTVQARPTAQLSHNLHLSPAQIQLLKRKLIQMRHGNQYSTNSNSYGAHHGGSGSYGSGGSQYGSGYFGNSGGQYGNAAGHYGIGNGHYGIGTTSYGTGGGQYGTSQYGYGNAGKGYDSLSYGSGGGLYGGGQYENGGYGSGKYGSYGTSGGKYGQAGGASSDGKYGSASGQYGSSAGKYGSSSNQYDLANMLYGLLDSQYGSSSSQYGAESGNYGAGSGSANYGSGGYGPGGGLYGSGSTLYGSGGGLYGTESASYGTGSSPYGTGGASYGAGSGPYGPYGIEIGPYGSGGEPYAPAVSPYGPGGAPYASDAGSYGSAGPAYGTDGKPYGDEGALYGTGIGTYGSGGAPYGSAGASYGSDGKQYGVGGKPYGPGGDLYGTGSASYGSAGVAYESGGAPYGSAGPSYGFGDNPYGPGIKPYGPGGKPYGPGGKPYGPGADSYGTGDGSYGSSGASYGPANIPYGSGGKSYGSGDDSYGTGSGPYGPTNVPYGSGSKSYGPGGSSYGSGSGLYGSAGAPYGSEAGSYATRVSKSKLIKSQYGTKNIVPSGKPYGTGSGPYKSGSKQYGQYGAPSGQYNSNSQKYGSSGQQYGPGYGDGIGPYVNKDGKHGSGAVQYSGGIGNQQYSSEPGQYGAGSKGNDGSSQYGSSGQYGLKQKPGNQYPISNAYGTLSPSSNSPYAKSTPYSVQSQNSYNQAHQPPNYLAPNVYSNENIDAKVYKPQYSSPKFNVHSIFEHLAHGYQQEPKAQFFPNYQGPGYGAAGTENYKPAKNIDAPYSQQPYANPQQNPSVSDSYTRHKISDLKTQIYGLENVINNLNRPEYIQKPEDHEMKRELDQKIDSLKHMVTYLSQDVPYSNSPGSDNLVPKGDYEASSSGSAQTYDSSGTYEAGSIQKETPSDQQYPQTARRRRRQATSENEDQKSKASDAMHEFFQHISDVMSVIDYYTQNVPRVNNSEENAKSMNNSSMNVQGLNLTHQNFNPFERSDHQETPQTGPRKRQVEEAAKNKNLPHEETQGTLLVLINQLNNLVGTVNDLTQEISKNNFTCPNNKNCPNGDLNSAIQKLEITPFLSSIRRKRQVQETDGDNGAEHVWNTISSFFKDLVKEESSNEESDDVEVVQEDRARQNQDIKPGHLLQNQHLQNSPEMLQHRLQELKKQLDSKLHSTLNHQLPLHNQRSSLYQSENSVNGRSYATPYYRSSYYGQPTYYQQPSYHQQPSYYPQPSYYYPKPSYYQQPSYESQEEKTKKLKFKKKSKKSDVLDKIFTKILDKIMDKIADAIPKVTRKILGLGLDKEDYGYEQDGYGYEQNGYGQNGYEQNSYGVQKKFKKIGLFGYIPMIILKLLTNLTSFVRKLQKNRFIKIFLVPALVTAGTAGLVVFLVWWLTDDQSGYGNYGNDGYNGGGYGYSGGYGGGYGNNDGYGNGYRSSMDNDNENSNSKRNFDNVPYDRSNSYGNNYLKNNVQGGNVYNRLRENDFARNANVDSSIRDNRFKMGNANNNYYSSNKLYNHYNRDRNNDNYYN